jgi:HAD superfamily hydrolase (TIGR01459 family)
LPPFAFPCYQAADHHGNTFAWAPRATDETGVASIMAEPTFCAGVAELAARYEHFVVDQWGVLHDGHSPYPDAIDCLRRLRADGRRVVLLSNSGKRTRINRARLREIGFSEELFDDVVTSGEATWRALSDRTDPFFRELGARCILWSRYRDRSLVEELDLEVVSDAEDADFLLLGGIEDAARLEDFRDALERAAARDLPMVCANPDIVAVQANGIFGVAPGAVARHYEGLGGRVFYVGKPHHPIYQLVFEALGNPAPASIVAIGDSVEHDIAGAVGMTLDTALIMSGIHGAGFDLAGHPETNRAALEQLEAEFGVRPRWLLPRFRWSPQ